MKELILKEITLNDVKKMSAWKYDGYLSEIDMSFYFKNLKDHNVLKGPLMCDGYSVYQDKCLFGLFEFYLKESGYIEIGLAMNPKFVGQGHSKDFILAGLNFMIKKYGYEKEYVMLSVEKKNKSAYYAYKKMGFKEVGFEHGEELMRYYFKS